MPDAPPRARARRTLTIPETPPLPAELMRDPDERVDDYDAEPDEDQSPEDRVIELLQGADGEGRAQVKVYRSGKSGTEYCGTYGAAEFEERNLDLIRENFGAGEYRILLYGPLPSDPRRMGLRSKVVVRIAESRAPLLANPAAPRTSDLAEVMRVMTEQNQQFQQTIVNALQSRPDPGAQLRETLGLMTAMREAMGLHTQPQTKSTIGEVVDAIRELKAVSGELGGDGAKEKDTGENLVELAKPVIELVSQAMNERRAPVSESAPLPAIEVPASIRQPNPAPAPSQPEIPDMGLKDLALVFVLQNLVKMAEKNEDIEKGAEIVYEKLPDELIELMELPHWFEVLAQTTQRVGIDIAPHQEWFTKVRDRTLAMFEEDAQDEGDETAPLSADKPAGS